MAECPGGNCPKEDVAPPGTDDAEVVGKTTEPVGRPGLERRVFRCRERTSPVVPNYPLTRHEMVFPQPCEEGYDSSSRKTYKPCPYKPVWEDPTAEKIKIEKEMKG